MGVYYIYICDELKERIEPGDIGTKANPDGGGIKDRPVCLGEAANVLVTYAVHGDWTGHAFRVVGDYEDDYDNARDEYEDATERAVNLFNERWGKQALKYIPDDDDYERGDEP